MMAARYSGRKDIRIQQYDHTYQQQQSNTMLEDGAQEEAFLPFLPGNSAPNYQ